MNYREPRPGSWAAQRGLKVGQVFLDGGTLLRLMDDDGTTMPEALFLRLTRLRCTSPGPGTEMLRLRAELSNATVMRDAHKRDWIGGMKERDAARATIAEACKVIRWFLDPAEDSSLQEAVAFLAKHDKSGA